MQLVLDIKQINRQKPSFGLKTWFEGHLYVSEDKVINSRLDLINIKIHYNYGLLRSPENCVLIVKKKSKMNRPAHMFQTKDDVVKYFKSKINYFLKLKSPINHIYIVSKDVQKQQLIDDDYPELLSKLN